jgi:hypothetical protein
VKIGAVKTVLNVVPDPFLTFHIYFPILMKFNLISPNVIRLSTSFINIVAGKTEILLWAQIELYLHVYRKKLMAL